MRARLSLPTTSLLAAAIGCTTSFDLPPEQNADPIANPGQGGRYLVGTTVTLDGSRSFDPDGDPLDYEWLVSARAPFSVAAIEDARSAVTQIELDVVGEFGLRLTVTDRSGAESTNLVRLVSEPPTIELDAGSDREALWQAPVELAASVAVEADKPFTVRWELIERPLGSSASVTNEEQLTASFVPDEVGRYVARVTAATPHNSQSDEVVLLVHAQQLILDGAARAVAYADSLDQFVTVSDAPPRIALLDPATGVSTSVALPARPENVSLALDGTRAIVGHESAVSIVTLEPLSVDQTIAVSTLVPAPVACALGVGARLHCVSRSGHLEAVQTIELGDGTVTVGDTAPLRSSPVLHSSGPRLYLAPAAGDLHRFDVTTPTATFVRSEPANAQGRVWLTRDGGSIITAGGEVLHSSDDVAIDMTRRALLAGTDPEIRSAADSPSDGRITTVYFDEIRTYDGQSFELLSSDTIPAAIFEGQFHPIESSGFVAYRSDGSALYVLASTGSFNVLLTLNP